MSLSKIKLLYNTLKFLRFKQIYYRLYYTIRNRLFKNNYTKKLSKTITPLTWENHITFSNSYLDNNTFNFLNINHHFQNEIDWNCDVYGKLWTYNLNYFDFLNQDNIQIEDGIYLIEDYIKNDSILRDGKEPYTISLRGINWIKFLSKNNISNKKIDQTLYNYYQILLYNLEYHLLGNHLLENAFSLFFAAYYFKDDVLHVKAKMILKEELDEQILKDGGHFELSPMYHQILLYRLLDCINLIQQNEWKNDELLLFLNGKANKMLSWLTTITFENGDIPMVNDSSYFVAPNSNQLFTYANHLKLKWNTVQLSDSGYRIFKKQAYELFIDVGDIKPDYQPGHAHADTLSFILYVNNNPIIVEPGVSTYEINKTRENERSTRFHNTVVINNQNSSQVWSGFRVAKRARIIKLNEGEDQIQATHNGYKNLGVLHTRKFILEPSKIILIDEISKEIQFEQVAVFHFHPTIKNIKIIDNEVKLLEEHISINFGKNILKIETEKYNYAIGFNKTKEAQKIKVYFNKSLETQIHL